MRSSSGWEPHSSPPLPSPPQMRSSSDCERHSSKAGPIIAVLSVNCWRSAVLQQGPSHPDGRLEKSLFPRPRKTPCPCKPLTRLAFLFQGKGSSLIPQRFSLSFTRKKGTTMWMLFSTRQLVSPAASTGQRVVQKAHQKSLEPCSPLLALVQALPTVYRLKVEPVTMEDGQRAAERWRPDIPLSLADRLCLALSH